MLAASPWQLKTKPTKTKQTKAPITRHPKGQLKGIAMDCVEELVVGDGVGVV